MFGAPDRCHERSAKTGVDIHLGWTLAEKILLLSRLRLIDHHLLLLSNRSHDGVDVGDERRLLGPDLFPLDTRLVLREMTLHSDDLRRPHRYGRSARNAIGLHEAVAGLAMARTDETAKWAKEDMQSSAGSDDAKDDVMRSDGDAEHSYLRNS